MKMLFPTALSGLASVALLLSALQAPLASAKKNTQPAKTAPAAKTGSGSVAYADLKSHKVALPYGQPFTITGDTTEVQVGGNALKDVMQAQTVAGDYTTSDGNKGTIAPSSITGTSWQVAIGKLAADTSVTFNFQLTGTLLAGVQQTVIASMMADPAYKAATSQFISAAQSKDSVAALGAMTLLSQATVDILTSILNQKGLTPKTPADLKNSLGPVILANIEPIFNLTQQFPELRNPALHVAELVGTDVSALSAQQLYEKLSGLSDADYQAWKSKSKQGDAVRNAVKEEVKRFKDAYRSVLAALNTGMQSVMFQGSSSLVVGNDQQSDLVSDLKKYAGFDVGALYAYRISELRSFAMVHIYFGPIDSKTEAPLDPNVKHPHWEAIRQRVSLAFGIALKDLSGASQSKISGENAFVYGVGVRLNKYFRLSAGGMLYRTTLPAANGTTSPANGALRQEIFVGPSIDVTALPALKSIFAKSQSN